MITVNYCECCDPRLVTCLDVDDFYDICIGLSKQVINPYSDPHFFKWIISNFTMWVIIDFKSKISK